MFFTVVTCLTEIIPAGDVGDLMDSMGTWVGWVAILFY